MSSNGGGIIQADPRDRKRAILIVVLTTLLGFTSLYLFQGFLREMEALESASPQLALEKLRPIGTAALGVTLVSSTGLAGMLVYVALCVIRARQWPPPGFRVAWDMPIRKGRPAIGMAVILIFLAGVAISCGAILLSLPEPEEQQEVPMRKI